MDGGFLTPTPKTTTLRRKSGTKLLTVEVVESVYNLHDPHEASRGIRRACLPLKPGRYEAKRVSITFQGKTVEWLVVKDGDEWKGKGWRSWRVENIQTGGVTIHERRM